MLVKNFLDYIITLISFILKFCGWMITISLMSTPLLIILLISSIRTMSFIEISKSLLLILGITFVLLFSLLYYCFKEKIYNNKKLIAIYIIISLLVIFINDGYNKVIISLMIINIFLCIIDYVKNILGEEKKNI